MLTLKKKPKIDQSWSVEQIALEVPPRTWEAVFEDAKYELHDVSEVLKGQERQYGMFFPLKEDIFAAFHQTPLSQVKVVILGQDPYPQSVVLGDVSMPKAVGLSFSVRMEDKIPQSLSNIYKVLVKTIPGYVASDHGDLKEWARQGVLLLNSCLTVRPGSPGSHGDIWLGFIDKVLRAIAAVNPRCIFLLWGREAQKMKPMLGERCVILETTHPSGFSANRGFLECNHFNMVNEILISQGKTPINWKISTRKELKTLSAGVPSVDISLPVISESLPKVIFPKIPNTKESIITERSSPPIGGPLLASLSYNGYVPTTKATEVTNSSSENPSLVISKSRLKALHSNI